MMQRDGQQWTDRGHNDSCGHHAGHEGDGVERGSAVLVHLVVHEEVDERREELRVEKVGHSVGEVNGPFASWVSPVGQQVPEQRRQQEEQHRHDDDLLDH